MLCCFPLFPPFMNIISGELTDTDEEIKHVAAAICGRSLHRCGFSGAGMQKFQQSFPLLKSGFHILTPFRLCLENCFFSFIVVLFHRSQLLFNIFPRTAAQLDL